VSDPDAGQSVRLEVEVQPLGTAFTGAPSCQSELVSSGATASCAVSSLSPGSALHWQARAVDSLGMPGSWVAFGGNSESVADFTVALSVMLTVTTAGSSSGTVTPSPTGNSCGTGCSQYTVGTGVTLTASPAAGGTFRQWRGDACNGSTSPTCPVTMTAAKSVTAVFSKTFTDPTLTVGGTSIKATHFTELRDAINTLRSRYSLGAFAWSGTTPLAGNLVTRLHLLDLRTALTEADQAAGRSGPTYAEPSIVAGQTTIKASHLSELRAFVRNLE
jgi:hypothetical protein